MICVSEEGESAATIMMTARLGVDVSDVRKLAYRPYHMCEQKNYAQEAQGYNALIQSCPETSRLSREIVSTSTPEGG